MSFCEGNFFSHLCSISGSIGTNAIAIPQPERNNPVATMKILFGKIIFGPIKKVDNPLSSKPKATQVVGIINVAINGTINDVMQYPKQRQPITKPCILTESVKSSNLNVKTGSKKQ